jgi:hypothetical protein
MMVAKNITPSLASILRLLLDQGGSRRLVYKNGTRLQLRGLAGKLIRLQKAGLVENVKTENYKTYEQEEVLVLQAAHLASVEESKNHNAMVLAKNGVVENPMFVGPYFGPKVGDKILVEVEWHHFVTAAGCEALNAFEQK